MEACFSEYSHEDQTLPMSHKPLMTMIAVGLLHWTAAWSVSAAGGPCVDGRFQGRIAYSCDGNHNDPDEWSATIRELEKFRSGYDAHGMLAISIDSEGLVGAEQIRTLDTQGIPEVPSPVFDGKHVYFVKNGGLLTCLDVKSGQRLYRTRTRGSGTHYASPLIADGKIYAIAGDGRISVLTLGANPEILAVNDMQDRVYATPAIVGGAIYVRTHSALFAFGAQ